MSRTIISIALVLFLALVASGNVHAAVSVTPSSVSVARGQASTVTLLYQLSAVAGPSPVTSRAGTFMLLDSTFIGSNPFTLTANLTATRAGGSGSAAETVVIPSAVIEQVLRSGNTSFIYQRSFSSGEIVNTRINITTDAAAAFGIKRIELYFENRRAESTIPKHFPNLRAFADIRYTGSGVLQGYWEVDGRVISRVHQMLIFGATVTLRTPEIPEMPTFDPGSHIVRFVITNPVSSLPVPALVYFVTPEEYRPIPVDVGLKSPGEGAPLSRSAARFEWETFKGATLFLVQYFENPAERPLFSAFTREPFYLLPELASKELFATGDKYYWKVTGYNDRDNIVLESATRSFMLK